jgi:UDP-GlcNAc:undecaprenyl-phosphate GlcNAc-1-phosphate transferase
LLLVWAAAFLVAIVAVWSMRWLTIRVGLVDLPDPTRKLHLGAISLGGGIAILLTLAIVLSLTQVVSRSPVAISLIGDWFGEDTAACAKAGLSWGYRLTALAVAASLITLLGVIDDMRPLSGTTKLLIQIGITALIGSFWSPAGNIEIFGLPLAIGALSGPLLMFWLLASINAVNLIDGADGVAGGFGVVSSLGIAAVALISGNETVAVLATVLSAALAGFLCFNRPPATIFLGDAGSMLVGLLLGALACLSVSEAMFKQDLLIPIALVGVPLFDSLVAITRRWLTGRSIYSADRGHIHHLVLAGLKSRQLSPTWIIPIFGGLAAVTAIGAVISTALRRDYPAVLSILLLVGGLVGCRVFGYAEARLLAAQTWRFVAGNWRRFRRGEHRSHVSGVALQGNRQWDLIWRPLVDFAEKNDLRGMRLDLNMPWLHEGYHGSWSRGARVEAPEQWSVRLPVICQGRVVGRLDIEGRATGDGQIRSLETFSFLVAELQPAIDRLVCSIDAREPGRDALVDAGESLDDSSAAAIRVFPEQAVDVVRAARA